MDRRQYFVALLLSVIALPVLSADKIRIANEGGIADEWALAPGAKLPAPAYPKAYEANKAETCVAIGYLLNADGTTSDFALLKSWSAAEPERDKEAFWLTFAQDASSALAHWKFVPRPEVASARPVYTVATFLFASSNAAELRKRCAIPNLGMHVIELRQDARLQRRMSGISIFDRLDVDPLLEQRYRYRERQENERMRRIEVQPQPNPPPPPQPPSPPSGGG